MQHLFYITVLLLIINIRYRQNDKDYSEIKSVEDGNIIEQNQKHVANTFSYLTNIKQFS